MAQLKSETQRVNCRSDSLVLSEVCIFFRN